MFKNYMNINQKKKKQNKQNNYQNEMLLRPISHFLIYSIAFGGTTFYSYVASPIAFKTLKREQFSILQNKVFPWYFTLQSVSPMALALTLPVPLAASAYYSLGVASIFGFVNLYGLLPWNKDIKEKRHILQKRLDQGEITKEQYDTFDEPLKKKFGKAHGLSLLVNMGHIMAMLSYGCYLTSGLLRYIPK